MNRIEPSDITVCITIRATDLNPWVIPRLKRLLSYYSPSPKFQIIDFGSLPPYKDEIESLCRDRAKYVYVNDNGVFALALSRNIAYENAETDLIFFSDVDFVSKRTFFRDLCELANAMNFGSTGKSYLLLPIYHLVKETTSIFESFDDPSLASDYLTRLSFEASASEFGQVYQFYAPYSNAFLINKQTYNLVGGFCDEFRGHGSEDFEFQIRLGLICSNFPIPEKLDKDFYGPLKPTFFDPQPYMGFRKYGEALTFPSQLSGLKMFHLFHESPRGKGYWTDSNDWKRNSFNKIIHQYYPDISNILSVDYLAREKKALCIFADKKSWGYFTPLRLLGYKLVPFCSKEDSEIFDVLNKVENKEFDRVFIFNPYMKSHVRFLAIIELARKLNIKVTVIERGGLPNTLYYADEVAYGDPDYKNLDDIIESTVDYDKKIIDEFLNDIKLGRQSLEKQGEYAKTYNELVLLRNSKLKKIFVPLQLPDDMAVTKFTKGYLSYDSFVAQIYEAAEKNKDFCFIVKQHPLSKVLFDTKGYENIILAKADANISCLIDVADYVVVYNSGVGLLSCVQGKVTFNVGNSYYSAKEYLSNQATDMFDVLCRIRGNKFHQVGEEAVRRYIHWILTKKYSLFSAKSVIKEFKDRCSHQYDNIQVERLVLDDHAFDLQSVYSKYQPSEHSILGHYIGLKKQQIQNAQPLTSPTPTAKKSKRSFWVNLMMWIVLDRKKYNKLQRDPEQFFADSRSNFIKSFKGSYIK